MNRTDFKCLQIGDEVTVRSLDSLLEEFGCERSGTIYNRESNEPCFSERMRVYCGKTFKVRSKSNDDNTISLDNSGYVFSAYMLEDLVPQPASFEGWEEMILEGVIDG